MNCHTTIMTKRPLSGICSMQRVLVTWAVTQGGGQKS